MPHAAQRQGAERLVVGHEGGVLLRQGVGVAAGHGHVHTPADHVLLEVLQPGVHPCIALFLLAVHVVQLGKDHLKGLRQRGDAGDLPAILAPQLLDPEVSVDQQQRLGGQIVRLQIPHGVVGGDVADVGHPPAAEPQVCVIVMEIRHPLAGAAAELADVVPRGGAGHQRHVHRRAAPVQGAGGGDGDMVDTGDMLQRAVGRDLQPQPHQLIDVLPLPLAQEFRIGRGAGAVGQLLLRKEIERPRRVVGQQLPLGGEQHLQHRQQEHRAGGVRLRAGLFRVQKPPGVVVGIAQPALLRRAAAQGVQLLPAQRQHIGAAQPRPVEQRGKALHIALRLDAAEQLVVTGEAIGGGTVGQTPTQRQIHLADTFFVHKKNLRRWGIVYTNNRSKRRAVSIFPHGFSAGLSLNLIQLLIVRSQFVHEWTVPVMV